MKIGSLVPGLVLWFVVGAGVCTGFQASGSPAEGVPVFLRVSVTDPLNRYVTDLKKENFKVYEDRVLQKIQTFEDSAAPVCVATVIDSTPAMRKLVEGVRKGLRSLFEIGNPANELILITFEQRTAQVDTFKREGVTSSKSPSFGNLATLSGLQDATFVALEELRKRTNLKRAFVIATDGGAAKVNMGLEIAGPGKEPEYQMFSISRAAGQKPGAVFPAVDMSAGSSYYVSDFSELDYYIELIYAEVRNQYVLGYVSTNARMDGKPRKLSVELELPPDAPKLTVKAKKSYMLPTK
jgi:Ca-activated chloride channel homolog